MLGESGISVLRDTRSNKILVRQALVVARDMTRSSSPIYFVDGTISVLPESLNDVHTQFCNRRLVAYFMETSPYDLILGNGPDIRAPTDPKSGWSKLYESTVPHENEGQGRSLLASLTAGMTTRTQANESRASQISAEAETCASITDDNRE